MNESNFSEDCPHCGEHIGDMHSRWMDKDYQVAFFINCPECGKRIEVEVHQVPEFECMIPICAFCKKVEVSGVDYCEPCLAKIRVGVSGGAA